MRTRTRIHAHTSPQRTTATEKSIRRRTRDGTVKEIVNNYFDSSIRREFFFSVFFFFSIATILNFVFLFSRVVRSLLDFIGGDSAGHGVQPEKKMMQERRGEQSQRK